MGVSIVKLTSDNETLAEGKVIILYILNKLPNPVSNESLYKLVLSINDMNYFYFQQFLLDLIDTKYVIAYPKGKETLYELTPEGRQALDLVKDLIPGYLKFKADHNFKENLRKIENELSITADFTPNGENDYTVKCKITENNKTIFEVQTFATSREQAKSIVDNWMHNADLIYPKLLEILTNNNESV